MCHIDLAECIVQRQAVAAAAATRHSNPSINLSIHRVNVQPKFSDHISSFQPMQRPTIPTNKNNQSPTTFFYSSTPWASSEQSIHGLHQPTGQPTIRPSLRYPNAAKQAPHHNLINCNIHFDTLHGAILTGITIDTFSIQLQKRL